MESEEKNVSSSSGGEEKVAHQRRVISGDYRGPKKVYFFTSFLHNGAIFDRFKGF